MIDLVHTAFNNGATREMFYGNWGLKFVNIEGKIISVFSDGDFSIIVLPEGKVLIYNDVVGKEITGEKICYTTNPSGEGWIYKEIREIEAHRTLFRDIAREY